MTSVIETAYTAWKLYHYVSTAYTTYETVIFAYGVGCTAVATTTAIANIVIPSNDPPKRSHTIERQEEDGWIVLDKMSYP